MKKTKLRYFTCRNVDPLSDISVLHFKHEFNHYKHPEEERHVRNFYKIRHYARWYGVDLLCAIAELRQLGLEVSPEREEAVKTTLRNRLEQKRKSQEELFCTDISCDSDETFAFIAGYTSGGAPYGVTWDEMEDADGEMK